MARKMIVMTPDGEKPLLTEVMAHDKALTIGPGSTSFSTSARGRGCRSDGGTVGASIRVATSDRPEALSAAWEFPTGQTGWRSLTDLTLGYSPASALATPSIASALTDYEAGISALRGEHPATGATGIPLPQRGRVKAVVSPCGRTACEDPVTRIDPRTGRPRPTRPSGEPPTTMTQLGITSYRILFRGATRRCPVCGSGHLFSKWFNLAKHCPRCGLRFEREPGTFIGAIGMNTIVTFASLMGVVAIGVVLTQPDIPTVPLTVVAVSWAIFVSLAGLPFTKALWLAIDLLLSPLRDDEAPHAPRVLPSGNSPRAAKARTKPKVPARPDLN